MVLAWSMDKVGPMCRSAFDCALVFDAVRGASGLDPSTVPAPFSFSAEPRIAGQRIGFTEDAPRKFLDQLEAMGARLSEIEDPPRGSSNSLSVESSAAMDYRIAPGGVEPEPLPQGCRTPNAAAASASGAGATCAPSTSSTRRDADCF